MIISQGYDKDKDLDFEKSTDYLFGKIGEELARDIFIDNNYKIEVKTERDKWVKTGNIAIEYESRGEWSGIITTKSEMWLHFLSINKKIVGAFFFRTSILREYIKNNQNKLIKKNGGDDNTSRLFLINIKENIREIYELQSKNL
mgnify:CR=1 FL=1|tara:strand:+ start:4298 stop:4729 length:432 start_codon:yes stop_codon:yes gene_type:complete